MVSSRNKTLACNDDEVERFIPFRLDGRCHLSDIRNRIINQDVTKIWDYFPRGFVDLVIMDPPYNLTKRYNRTTFRSRSVESYSHWFHSVVKSLYPLLKDDASLYICSDWRTSMIIAPILMQYFKVRNRITWCRNKGRGTLRNWKNNMEDIWFCTVSDKYHFNVESVKVKKRVLAPYRTSQGHPKDWVESSGGRFRLTYPSNIWTDITVPFWSMSENTVHPTQKSEKLIQRLILASSDVGMWVFDPFLGSGTSAVVARRLGRIFTGVEMDRYYCCLGYKRLGRLR